MRYAPLLLLAACGGGDALPDAARADAEAADALSPDALCGDCTATEPYLREIVAKLAGAAEIAPGVTLTARASESERETTRVFLLEELTRLGLAPARDAYGTGTNIVAVLPPTGGAGGALVVVGAHFDGVPVGPAAADDGTGVALVLAAARHLVAAPVRDRPVAFVLFDEEELGLVGSTRYAEALFTAQTPVDSVHVFDMISFDGDRDGAVELWSPSAPVEAMYRLHAEPLGMPIQPVAFQYSDHQSFVERGFPTAGVSEEFVADDHTPHYHQPTDTYENVDFAYLTAVAELAFLVIEDAATD